MTLCPPALVAAAVAEALHLVLLHPAHLPRLHPLHPALRLLHLAPPPAPQLPARPKVP